MATDHEMMKHAGRAQRGSLLHLAGTDLLGYPGTVGGQLQQADIPA